MNYFEITSSNGRTIKLKAKKAGSGSICYSAVNPKYREECYSCKTVSIAGPCEYNISINNDASTTGACRYEFVNLYTQNIDGASYKWTNQAGQTISTSRSFNYEVEKDETIKLTVTKSGCPTRTDNINIHIFYNPRMCDRYYGPEGEMNDREDKLEIYPQPAKEGVTIKLTGEDSFQVQVFDMTGKVMRAFSLNGTKELLLNEFSSGIYIINATNGSKKITEKLIVE